jgi:dihydrofolate reductase
MTRFIIIVAHAPNLVIGKDGALPWRIPEDLKHFKRTTLGFPLLMGRGVFEELNEKTTSRSREFCTNKQKLRPRNHVQKHPRCSRNAQKSGL